MTKDENGILKQMCAPCVQGEMAALGMPKLVLVLVVEKKKIIGQPKKKAWQIFSYSISKG